MSKVPYAYAIGSLMYTMLYTRPDICFAIVIVNRYQNNPGPAHWKVVKRILRYIHETIDHVLCYHGEDLRLTGYSDADWASDKDDRKSTLGYAFILGGGAVSWYNKKQSCISLFTMESEYVACSATVEEIFAMFRCYSSCKGFCITNFDTTSTLAYAKKTLSIMGRPNTLRFDTTTFEIWFHKGFLKIGPRVLS
jgi:hypothetical protein